MANTSKFNGDLQVGSAHFYVQTSDNKVGIQTITPDSTLHVVGNIHATTNLHVDSNIVCGGNLHALANLYVTSNIVAGSNIHAGSNIFCQTLDATRVLGDASGMTNIPTAQLNPPISVEGTWSVSATDSAYLYWNPSGYRVGIGVDPPTVELDVTGAIKASGDITAFSDIRRKTDIQKIEGALEKVGRLSGYTFKRIDDEDQKRVTGLLAQEVLEVLPEAVHGTNEEHYSLAYGNMVGLLVEAIKELKQEVEILRSKIQ